MADRTAIEWTDASWTPVRARNRATGKVGWHCEHVSEGCRFCYADERSNKVHGTGLAYKPGNRDKVDLFLDEKMLTAPLRWRKPRKIFVCSTTDLFADFVPDAWIDKVFAVMALCPQHTFQVLTKRPERMRDYFGRCAKPDSAGFIAEDIRIALTTLTQTPSRRALSPALRQIPLGKYCQQIAWPLPNVWLGVSCEDQATADERIPILLDTPAALRFVSAEPILGPMDLLWALNGHACQECADWGSTEDGECDHSADPGYAWKHDALTQAEYSARPTGAGLPELGSALVNWVIVGGESGPHARPMHPDWARSLCDQCAAADVPFFFKQWGEWTPGMPVGSGEPGRFAIWYEHGDRWAFFDETPRHFSRFGQTAGMTRVGKKAAGALLDGREWRQFPEASTAASLPLAGVRPSPRPDRGTKAAEPASGGGAA